MRYLVASTLVVFGIIASIWAFAYFSADTRGAIKQQEIVRADGQFRVASYNHFFDLCSSIQSQEARIKNLEEEKETADEFRMRQINPALTAIKNKRAELINQYNVDAEKEGSVGIFRSAKLPARIDPNAKETECVF